MGPAGDRQQPSGRRPAIGTGIVAKAPADGHMLLVTTIAFAINAGLQKLPFDAVNDFSADHRTPSIPLMLVVHPSLPVQDAEGVHRILQGAAGGPRLRHLGRRHLHPSRRRDVQSMTGAKLVHVPFKGNAEVMNALLGGHVKVHFALAPRACSMSKRSAARARGHHRTAAGRPAGRADRRRARLSRLRDQLPGRACSRRPVCPPKSSTGSTGRSSS